jgi:hypothetical protein
MRRAAFAGLAALLAAAPAARAHAETLTARSRLVAGLNGAAARFGVNLALERRLLDRVWLGAAAGISRWTEGSSLDAGYAYARLDLGLTPRFALYRWSLARMTTELDAALPIGLSRSYVDVPMRRAFDERVDGLWGWHLGGTLSATFLFHRRIRPAHLAFGARLGVGVLRHTASRRTTFTPTDAAQAPIVAETDVVDQELVFAIAGVLAF